MTVAEKRNTPGRFITEPGENNNEIMQMPTVN